MTELVDELVKMSCEFAEIKKYKEQEVKSASVLKKGKVQNELVEADDEKCMAQMFRDVSVTACRINAAEVRQWRLPLHPMMMLICHCLCCRLRGCTRCSEEGP